MEKEIYEAQGICMNCGYANYPQWGVFKIGTKIADYPCPYCGCNQFVPDTRNRFATDPDLGKTGSQYNAEDIKIN